MSRALTVVVLSAVVVVAWACVASAAATINVGDNYFVRPTGKPTVLAASGQRVTFRFVGRVSHEVTVASGPVKFRSPIKASGSYRTPVLTAGTYRIYCKIHGKADQSMTLKVK